MSTQKISILSKKSQNYPELLSRIYDPPGRLYIRGAIPDMDGISIAVVGARAPTSYGKAVTETIVPPLAMAGIIIVSGLARGIDGLAHWAALRAGGKTIAVLGSGIDDKSIYPREHKLLAHKIIKQGGAVISEYPPGTPGLPKHFPARNRIIAGLCSALIVIEARERSGSLITAKFALDENREVFAVPGPITRQTSVGTNLLIASGAHPLLSANNVFEVLGIDFHKPQSTQTLSPEENKILSLLGADPVHIDDLALSAKLDIASISATLTRMELEGIVRDIGGAHFIATNR